MSGLACIILAPASGAGALWWCKNTALVLKRREAASKDAWLAPCFPPSPLPPRRLASWIRRSKSLWTQAFFLARDQPLIRRSGATASAIHAEAFSGGPENGQQNDGEGVQHQQAITTLRVVDPERTQSHSETQVFAVEKTRFDGPAFGIEIDDLRGGKRRVAGNQMRGFFHALGFHADISGNPLARSGVFGLSRLARARCSSRACRGTKSVQSIATTLLRRSPTASRTHGANKSQGETPALPSSRSTCLIPDFGKVLRACARA